MHYVDVLPAELWLIIFEMALESSLEPEKLRNSTTFPVIIHHFRYPWKYGPASDPPIRNLRLACRTFYTLLTPSIPLHCFYDP